MFSITKWIREARNVAEWFRDYLNKEFKHKWNPKIPITLELSHIIHNRSMTEYFLEQVERPVITLDAIKIYNDWDEHIRFMRKVQAEATN